MNPNPSQGHLETRLTIHEAAFDVLRFNVGVEIDNHAVLDIDLHRERLARSMGEQLIAEWRVPGKVLADDKVIAEYPASLWDHIKAKLGLTHQVKTVRLTEHIAFPQLQHPRHLGPIVRVRWTDGLEIRA